MGTTHYDIPVEISNQISELVKLNAVKFSEQNYSMDSITVYFEKAVSIGLYQAEIETAMK